MLADKGSTDSIFTHTAYQKAIIIIIVHINDAWKKVTLETISPKRTALQLSSPAYDQIHQPVAQPEVPGRCEATAVTTSLLSHLPEKYNQQGPY